MAKDAKRIQVPTDICPEASSAIDLEQYLRDQCAFSNVSASPGYTYGGSGNISNNTWLLNDTVPSNKAGRSIFLYNAKLLSVFVMNEKETDSFDLEIYEHEGLGSTYTLIHTTNFPGGGTTGDRIVFDNLVTPAALTTKKGLGILLTNGSGKNITAGLLISGTRTP